MKIKLRPLFFKIGLFSLMAASICFALMVSGIAGSSSTTVAYILGVLFIVACCALSLNTTSSILDAPKDRVSPFYRKLAMILAIATGILALLWIIVLFAGQVNVALRYIVGKKFNVVDNNVEAAQKAAHDLIDKMQPKLLLTQIAIAFTIILAYVNLVATNKFALKNRMRSIQFVLYLSAFVFFAWFFILIMTYAYDYVEHLDKGYIRVILRSSVSALGSAISAFVLISSFMVFMIMKISSARSVRHGRNQILYGSNEELDIDETPTPKEVKQEVKEETKPVENTSTPTNDIKDRLEKLKELHNQGLINDEDYEKKKKDIIDSL